MNNLAEIIFLEIEENEDYKKIIENVLKVCFKEENIKNPNLYITITLTTLEKIQEINKEYRNIDKPTDVLSFPMFEKDEINQVINNSENTNEEILGDIIISIEKVSQQAIEYGHSFERELAYMVVHGFYHLMGEDHIEENDKKIMRQKEENILNILNITR